MTRAGFIASAILAGLVGAAVLVGVVFATGQTFGQRCAAAYDPNTATWNQCVERLAHGGKL